MEPHRVGTPLFIADANVLIDYLNADLAVLGKVAKHLGPVFVLRVVLRDEVRGLSVSACTKLGLEVVDSSVEMLTLAAAREAAAPLLSFYDWLVLLEAQHRGGACLSNDGALLKACVANGVEPVRGLAPLLQLVDLGKLRGPEALGLVEKMASHNSYLTKVIPEFSRRLKALKK